MAKKLANYIRTHRKRLGLTQKELAYIVDASSGAKVSHFESFDLVPSLHVAIACQVLFGESAEVLFAGMFETVRRRTVKRMKSVSAKLDQVDVKSARELRRNERVAAVLELRLPNKRDE